ncbi:MAG: trypsin-like peptidase domain-containing protein [Desulfatitalea sp.]|nr:serine protease [Desulfatitalea sp.]NNK01990.1 trypsin-like peptidase domain-containing protein [Desulfatitalea sp.]
MIRISQLVICLSMINIGLSSPALGSAQDERILSIPLSETEAVITPWLEESGFTIYRNALSGRTIQLEVEKGRYRWHIKLRPHSALGTQITMTGIDGDSDLYRDAFWAYLDSYIHLPTSRKTPSASISPRMVRSFVNAAVCIYTVHKGVAVQLSGFGIDRNGLIVSTAHDLEMDRQVDVQFRDGSEAIGRVVKLDAYRDLCLVKVPRMLSVVIPVREGRYLPAKHETLFALSCPQNGLDAMQRGYLDGPPRRVDGLPLWQVRMPVAPGSSGAAVLDQQGRLAAVVKGRYRGTDNVGFFIPFETLLNFLQKY